MKKLSNAVSVVLALLSFLTIVFALSFFVGLGFRLGLGL